MSKVTYFYSGKRKNKVINQLVEAKELYYSYHKFCYENYDVEIVEFSERKSLFRIVFYLYDKLLNKFFSIPSYSHKVFSIENYRKIKNSDQIFLVNEGVAFSVLPMLFFLKKNNKTQINVFSMGLFSKKVNKKYLFMHNLFINFLIANVDNLLFLGKGEMEHAISKFSTNDKFKFISFSVDEEFWISDKDYYPKNPELLFVGNDSNKDPDTVVRLAKMLPEFNITCVSKFPELHSAKLDNLIVYDGQWNDSSISDKQLKKLYESSFLTIIPLFESFQPSGQSVAMQSMISGTPVVITNTEGFWDKDAFKDNEHIFFIESNDVDLWINKIKYLFNNQDIVKSVSDNGKNLILENYNLDIFHRRLKELINSQLID